MVGVFCFRNDLRIQDNHALQEALHACDLLYLVYTFENRVWKSKDRKVGFHRASFLLQSLHDLENSIKSKGGGLSYLFGNIEDSIPLFMDKVNADTCFISEENAWDERLAEKSLSQKVSLKTFYDKTLIHLNDLPFKLEQLTPSFSKFRNRVEKQWEVRDCTPPLKGLNKISDRSNGLPSLAYLQIKEKVLSQGYFSFIGGSTEGRKRLNEWMWNKKCISTYKKTRNQLKGSDFSSRFSPWISNGCLSSKEIYHEIKKYEAQYGSNESTYWLIFELLWRDYFQFLARLHGSKIFQSLGLSAEQAPYPEPPQAESLFQRWKDGQTANRFINGNMNELRQTGWMSNRGRQNVASYLIYDLGLDWRKGAQWFEQELIDYDPCSNYGNWLYISGYGSSTKEIRYFNTTTQSALYDPNGEYTEEWT